MRRCVHTFDWVAGVFGNSSSLPLAPPDIEVLDGTELGPAMC